MAEVNVAIPEAPAFLPPDMQKKWQSKYKEALERAQQDFPDDEPTQMQAALREANQLLRVPKFTSYDQVMAAPEWHFVKRAVNEKKNLLEAVTIDGKKHSYPLPKEGKSKPAGQGAGATT